MSPKSFPRYDPGRTYDWNYNHPPDPVEVEIPSLPGEWSFLGLPAPSPLGVPAGPLLNGRWVLYYSSLGFDVLTYKTVRSLERSCYPLPNLQPVETGPLKGGEEELRCSNKMLGSWAVSFGMPSKSPDVWRRDVEWTRENLPKEKLLSVSVVGTAQEGGGIEELADDYALCAAWAVESGADCVETNFSCPNVSTRDGQLYQEVEAARIVAARVREKIGRVPYLVKIGHVTQDEEVAKLVEAMAPFVDGMAMTNSVATKVRTEDGALLFEGQCRGICGEATREASLEQTRRFDRIVRGSDNPLSLIGVGGASKASHVSKYLEAGAEAVHVATAAMVDPGVAIRIRAEMGTT